MPAGRVKATTLTVPPPIADKLEVRLASLEEFYGSTCLGLEAIRKFLAGDVSEADEVVGEASARMKSVLGDLQQFELQLRKETESYGEIGLPFEPEINSRHLSASEVLVRNYGLARPETFQAAVAGIIREMKNLQELLFDTKFEGKTRNEGRREAGRLADGISRAIGVINAYADLTDPIV